MSDDRTEIVDAAPPLPDFDAEPLIVGQKYRQWHITRRIPVGAMSSVYVGEDTNNDFKVVIKTISKQQMGLLIGKRFLLESFIWGTLPPHPNLVFCYGIFSNDVDSGGPPKVITEYLEDGSLQDVLDAGKPSDVEWALQILCDICEGMEFLAEFGVAPHRDLKPANILLKRKRRGCVADFGLATMRELGDASAAELVRAGSGHYKSPEQVRGLPVGIPSDIFSFGIVMFELLEGRELDVLHRGDELIFDLDWGHTPPPLRGVIEACTQIDPHDRPESFREVDDAIRAVANELGIRLLEADPVTREEAEAKLPGSMWAARGNNYRALSTLMRKLHPDWVRSFDLDALDQLEKALECIERAIEVEPDAWGHRMALGDAHAHAGNFDDAIEAYKEEIERFPDNRGPVLLSLGGAYAARGDYQAAVNSWAEASELMPLQSTHHITAAGWHKKLGDDSHCRHVLEQVLGAMNMAPPEGLWPYAWAEAAIEAAKFGERDLARKYVEAGLEKHPKSFVLGFDLAVLALFDRDAVGFHNAFVTLGREHGSKLVERPRCNFLLALHRLFDNDHEGVRILLTCCIDQLRGEVPDRADDLVSAYATALRDAVSSDDQHKVQATLGSLLGHEPWHFMIRSEV